VTSPVIAASATTEHSAVDTSHSVTIPTHSSGDVLLVAFNQQVPSRTETAPTGWDAIVEWHNSNANTDPNMLYYSRVADGTATDDFTITFDGTTRSSAVAFVLTGVDTVAGTNGIEIGGYAYDGTGTDTSPDPGSITPTGGAKDYLFLAVGATTADTGSVTVPTNYTLVGTVYDGYNSQLLSIAKRALNASSENPGAFAMPASKWMAGTIAIHPAAGGGGTAALSSSGAATVSLAGQSLADSVLSSSGTSSVSIVGQSLVAAIASMAGVASDSLVGASLVDATLSVAGTGSASWAGTYTEPGAVLSLSGTSTASFAAQSQVAATLSAAGAGSVSFVVQETALTVDGSPVYSITTDSGAVILYKGTGDKDFYKISEI